MTVRQAFRAAAAALFIAAGANHFRNPDFYASIVPPGFPRPFALGLISGFFEIAGGAGLLVGRLRRAAGWGLIALLVAVFPANVHMARHPEQFHLPKWVLLLRLPLQLPLIAWVWWVAIRSEVRKDWASPAHPGRMPADRPRSTP